MNHHYYSNGPSSNVDNTRLTTDAVVLNNNTSNTTATINNPHAEVTITATTTSTTATTTATNNLWESDVLENDEFDSDQLDEDESYSWASGITDNQDAIQGGGSSAVGGGGHGGIGSGALNGCGNSSTANWRDWSSSNFVTNLFSQPFVKQQSLANPTKEAHSRTIATATNMGDIPKLVDLCAKYVALNVPFELVESFRLPVPEDLQLKITFSSFPDNIENIRLYSCLANGNVDEYLRGDQLYNNRCVRKIIQIGFHLSAQVVISSPLGLNGGNMTSTNSREMNVASSMAAVLNKNQHSNNMNQFGLSIGNGSGSGSLFASVAIVCDRKRIISCNCTCSKQSVSWCSHIVAVCLFRILEPNQVEYRAPVSESLSKLQRDQLQKFAQYLISELPQQILPTAQKLLDELLKSNETSINLLSGAPDPTAGASQTDISVWCLDEAILQENIHKALLKFIVPTPNVVSDIECLEHASSATAAEYTSLLRPLRGREPEGMWNLISIVREMFRRRDKNFLPLLRIISIECISIDQIVQLWFLVKSSQLYHDKALFNTVTTGLGNSRNNNSSSNNCLTPPVHQACASLMDEIVTLWRIACLNPLLNDQEEKDSFREQLTQWHQNIVERLRKFCTQILNSNSNTNGNIWSSVPGSNSSTLTNANNFEKLLKRLDMDLFSGFLPAVVACEMNWHEFDFESPILFKQQALRLLPSPSLASQNNEISNTYTNPTTSATTIENPIQEKQQQTNENQKATHSNDILNNLYSFEYDPHSKLNQIDLNANKEEEIFRIKLKKDNLNNSNKEETRLEVLFSRCEALHAHGFNEQACILAEILADYMLSNAPNSLFNNNSNTSESSTNNVDGSAKMVSQNDQIFTSSSSKSSSGLRHKCLINFQGTILWRSYLLCYVLHESSLQLSSHQKTDFNLMNSTYGEVKTSRLNQLAFRIGLFGLETPRLPAISKALEVKLINQEQDLVNLLKRLQIGSYELNLLRDRARKLKDYATKLAQTQRNSASSTHTYNTYYYSLPIMLASFTFDILSFINLNQSGDQVKLTEESNVTDQQLGFDASIAVIGMKANISESQHALLCEGVRRQKGDLALTLLLTYKDDDQSLLKIIDKILDRDVHILFKQTSILSFNPFNPNFKKIQQQQLNEFNLLGLDSQVEPQQTNQPQQQPPSQTPQQELQSVNQASSTLNSVSKVGSVSENEKVTMTTATPSLLNASLSTSTKYQSHKLNSAIDSLSSGWEESENESPNLSGDVSLLETKYRCLSLRQQQSAQNQQIQQTQQEQQLNESHIRETTSSDNSPTTNRRTVSTSLTPRSGNSDKQENTSQLAISIQSSTSTTTPIIVSNRKTSKIDDSGDDSAESSSGAENSNKPNLIETSNDIISKPIADIINEKTFKDAKSLNEITSPSSSLLVSNNLVNNTKFNYNNLINQMNLNNINGKQYNQPSEALAHFMFEFSKTVLSKAGGSISTSVFLNNQNHQQGGGPHRNLHICSFLISLYALGLHNCVQPSWLSRTYSSHVTWVNSQAVDIGFPAICILIECWHGLLTPSECVSLADRVSRGRDNMAVKAAAELAFSSLRYAHLMNLTEIQRALIQCKEQSSEMLQRACIIVEHAVKDASSSNLLEILFTVAKKWDELFLEHLKLNNNSNINLTTGPTSTSSLTGMMTIQQQYPTNYDLNSGGNQMNFQFDATTTYNVNNRQPSAYGVGPTDSNSGLFLPQLNNYQKYQQHLHQHQVQPLTTQLIQQNLFQSTSELGPNNPNQTAAVAAAAAVAVYTTYMNTSAASASRNSANQQNQIPNFGAYQATNINLNNNSNLTSFQLNQMLNYQQQYQIQNYQQNVLRQQQQQQFLSSFENIDSISLNYLKSSFRVGMLGLEALPRRVDGSHQIKYRQSPTYADDVKWLWEVANKLDFYQKSNSNLQLFCQTAAMVIQNPFLLQEIAFESAKLICHNNLGQALCSPPLNILVQRCLNLYFRCCMSKLHHLTLNEHEDFINMLLTARNIFYCSGNMNYFSELIQNLRRSNKCKKEIWTKICNALNNHN